MFAQPLHSITPDPLDRRVKYPVTVRHRNRTVKIYAPGGECAYRWFGYAVDRVMRESARGSQPAFLCVTQSRDPWAALERFQGFYQSGGCGDLLLMTISEFAGAGSKFERRTLDEAVSA